MPKPARRSPAPVIAALAAFACSAPALALEHTRLEPVWFETAAPDGGAGHTAQALLNLPPGWLIGDAGVVILSDRTWPGLARERLVAALLEEEAAVLEFDVAAARGPGPENARPEAPVAAELMPGVRGAVRALRRDAGAGLVVALGYGAGGEAAVLSASPERTTVPEDTGLVAAASLGPGPARFALGGAAPGRGWPVRAERLCGVLAKAAAPSEARAEAECRRALLDPGEGRAVRLAGP